MHIPSSKRHAIAKAIGNFTKATTPLAAGDGEVNDGDGLELGDSASNNDPKSYSYTLCPNHYEMTYATIKARQDRRLSESWQCCAHCMGSNSSCQILSPKMRVLQRGRGFKVEVTGGCRPFKPSSSSSSSSSSLCSQNMA